MVVSTDQLLGMSKRALDELFRDHPQGEIPSGEGHGTVILGLGRLISELVSKVVRRIAWQGKVFDPVKGELRNEISPLSERAIRAKVYMAPSLLDEKECIVLDYSHTSFVARRIRDEIREVAPGLFLGIAYWGRRRFLFFALAFPTR